MTVALNSTPRFLLLLSAHSNLLRAALITRELHIVASAQQTFQITNAEFDPAEVWYKTKKVIAACLDIGRILSREIAALAIVTQEQEAIVWHERENEIIARGQILSDAASFAHAADELARGIETLAYVGNIGTYLVWNLTGEYVTTHAQEFGKTRVRAPFDAAIPIVAVLSENEARAFAHGADVSETDRALMGAARWVWERGKDANG